jgi:hypothetical protein
MKRRRLALASSAWLALCAALEPSAVAAQTVEATLNAFLTARVSWPTASGERSLPFRIGTKDLVAPLLEELGKSGRIVGLVARRQIGDFAPQASQDFLVVDGARFALEGRVRPPATALPASFFASSRASAVRRGTAVELYFADDVTEALQVGDLDTHGSELTVVGRAQRVARLLTQQGRDVGYLFSSVRLSAVGGLTDSFAWAGGFQGTTAIVSGWLLRGPEKLVVAP